MRWTVTFGKRYSKLFSSFIRSQNIFWTKSLIAEVVGPFATGPVNKAVPSSRKRLREYRKAAGTFAISIQ